MNAEVDTYMEKIKRWPAEIALLRGIVLQCGLKEELKWRVPCYSYNKANILILNTLKDYCSIGFFKGALLSDTDNILIWPGENSQTVKMIKFTSAAQIAALEKTLKNYIFEAIEVEKAGLKVDFSKSTNLELSPQLIDKMTSNAEFKAAFEALTPGRQRAYNMHFKQAKQSKTAIARIENATPRIMMGKGPNDCICGLSKRMPTCDGSHRNLR